MKKASTTGSNKKKSSCPSSKKQQQQQPQRGGVPEHKFPVEPVVIAVVNKPREFMNHSYRDFSHVPAEIGYEHPTKITDMTFSQKVHDILSQPEYKAYIAWHPHGRSFKIFIPQYFERSACEKYFGHKRYSSFLRMLNNYGFKHISKGPDRNSYYHEFFLEGRPHLCKYMPLCKDARRLVPDPENEPDFYKISAQYPLKKEHEQLQLKQQVVGTSSYDKNVQDEEKEQAWWLNQKPAAKQQPEYPEVSSFALNAVIPTNLSACALVATGPTAVPMTFNSQIESAEDPRAADSAANNKRLASDVSWLLQRLPPAKVHRPATTLPLSYHSASTVAAAPDTTAAWLRGALDVAQARRHQQDVVVAASLARQQLLLQQDEAVLLAAVEAAQARQEEQQRQEAALLALVQQRKQEIISRLLGVETAAGHSSSELNTTTTNNNNNNNESGHDTMALLEYIRRMKQHDG